jgi:Fic family protein
MWTWQHKNWPNFEFDPNAFNQQIEHFKLKSARLMGTVEALPSIYKTDATVSLMLSEAIKTSAIEGEALDRDSVRSSIMRLIAEDSTAPTHKDAKVLGAAALMVDIRKEWSAPINDDLLGRWQSMVIAHQPLSLVMRGIYRNAPEPMQIVSGVYGTRRIYYEAPPAEQIYEEMAAFLTWYNTTSDQYHLRSSRDNTTSDQYHLRSSRDNTTTIPGPVRAAVAHAWFEIIHPFDDGNGRVGRAISDHALSQSLNQPTLACLATAIERNRKEYYAQLQKISCGNLNLNEWIEFFICEINNAQDIAKEEVDFVLGKARFWERYEDHLNGRQTKMVNRVFAEGIKGFEGGISTKKYEKICNCSRATAYRDLLKLLKIGVIEQLPGGGRNSRYQLVN